MNKVLIITNGQPSDELVNYLEEKDYSPITVETREEGLDKIENSRDLKVVLINVESSGKKGLRTLKQIKNIPRKINVILIGAGVQTARKGMLYNALDVLSESTDMEGIHKVLESAFKRQTIRRKAARRLRRIYKGTFDRAFNRPPDLSDTFDTSDEDEDYRSETFFTLDEDEDSQNKYFLVGEHRTMFEVNKAIGRIANRKVSVWLEGEPGTGKGWAARLIHEDSNRSEEPFVTIDCGAVPEELFESEMFGHKEGAFTNAESEKKGKIEEADGGVLFLDEVGNMPLSQQKKLLNVLQTGKFMRVGETKETKADVRVISATNRNLEEMMEREEFRKDLYQRLCAYKISLPPLREKKDDIPLLVANFLQRYKEENDKPIYGVSKEVRIFFRSYNWPGNVRELENCLKAAIANSQDDVILLNDLPPEIYDGSSNGDSGSQDDVILFNDLPPEIYDGSSNGDSDGNGPERQSSRTLVTPVREKLFDLPVVVLCKLIADVELGIPDEWWSRFSDDGFSRVAKARDEIESWELEWNTTWFELSDLSERIKTVVDGAIAKISHQHQIADEPIAEAEPISIEGRTLRGSLTAVLHEVVKAHGYDREKAAHELNMQLEQLERRLSYIVNEEEYGGDLEKAAEALRIHVSQLEEWISKWTNDDRDDRKNKMRTDKVPSSKLRPAPFRRDEIRRLLTKSVTSFVLDNFSRVQWRDKNLKGKIRTVHLALKVLSKRLNKEHGYFYFGGMTFSQIERSIYRRAPYIYKTPQLAAEALNVDMRTLRKHWPRDKEWPWAGDSLSHDTLFIG